MTSGESPDTPSRGSGGSAVLVVSHGTVDDLDDLSAFVTNVRRGQRPDAELVKELRRRYEVIGGRSPLNAVNASVAAKLAARLGVRTAWASRLWRPYVRDVLAELAREGVSHVAVLPLAQHSTHVYGEDARRAAAALGGLTVSCAPDWGRSAALHEAFVRRIRATVGDPGGTTVVLTAHSLPRVVVERGDPYERDVRAAAAAISERLGADVRTVVAFQSQGFGKPDEWLGPELGTVIGDAAARGDRRVVLAPVGFLADHVEILYDLDVEAAAMARDRHLSWARVPSLNDDDDFIDVLAGVARPLLDGLPHA
jgi:protoporphyrin/coproporphyrin ferrochelatase